MVRWFLLWILSNILVVLPLLILSWAVWRWSKASPRVSTPSWRYYLALAATALAGTSSLLWLISIIWAHVIGGFPFYDPVLLRFYRWGSLTAASGLFISFVGKGKLRWPSCGVSALMMFLWLAAAMGE